ncbi:NCS2 family permease [Neisseria sp. Ec49-e6-T10]|uniref:NCS2 family permease n=1 Tax=Neisseria sp. Ec49-e6-T10 TaxID=3140744 RepID=UPI003EBD3128
MNGQTTNGQLSFLDRFFKLSENGTNVKTEVLAGLTIFLAMSYIVVANPNILAGSGMNHEAVFVATCIAAALGSAMMGIVANYPVALAPGMGLNAYFTFSVVKGMGVSWEIALGAVFFSGILFILLSLFKIREALINALPKSLKFSIAAGIGLFLGLIALKGAGIVKSHPETYITLGNLTEPAAIYAICGFFLIIALDAFKIKGAVIIGILTITIAAVLTGHAQFAGIVSPPPSLEPTFMQMDLKGALSSSMLGVIFVFFFVDLFDSSGTLVAVAHRANLLKDGKLPRLKKALLADSTAIVAGAALGTSSTVAYVESAAGAAVGGKTGLTACVVAILFLACLWFSPLAKTVPEFAIAPALLFVAVLMARGFAEIDWSDLTEAAPAFITAIAMPFTYSIANGIALGFISYTVIKILSGRIKDVTPTVFIVSILWVLKFVILG